MLRSLIPSNVSMPLGPGFGQTLGLGTSHCEQLCPGPHHVVIMAFPASERFGQYCSDVLHTVESILF